MINELNRFLLAAREGNITKSAEKIFITQSAFTQSIQRLEKELGTKLFLQKGKYLQLTEDGKILINIGSKIVQLWENAKDPALRNLYQRSYSIGMFDNAALRLGPYLQKNIVANNNRLELKIDSSTKLFAQLKLGVLDAAICVLSKKNTLPKNISLVETFTEELIPVSSKKYTGKIQSIPFIFYNKESHTREQTDKVFAENNTQPDVFAESTSTSFMKELALLGSGIALLPKNFIRAELQQGILIKQHIHLVCMREYGLFLNEESALDKNHVIIREIIAALKKAT